MAITLVQKTPSGNLFKSGKVTDAFASAVTVGNVVVAIFAYYYSGNLNITNYTFSDSKGNTWYIDKYINNYDSSDSTGLCIGHCNVTTGGSTFTVTMTCSNATVHMIGAYEFSGLDNTLTAGGSASASATGTATDVHTGNVTIPDSSNYLLIAMAGQDGYTHITGEDAGLTRLHVNSAVAEDIYDMSDYKIITATTNPGWTLSGTDDWACAAVAYKEPAAAGIPKHMSDYLRQMERS